MKKLILSTILLVQFSFAFSQKADTLTTNNIRTAADLKSGNSQDILPSFFQLALNDLTSNNRSFQFSSSILAIEAKNNPSLLIDTNYLKQNFARNFVFSIGLGVDQSFKFKNSMLAIKYAIINERDKSIYNFPINNEQEWNKTVTAAEHTIEKELGREKYFKAADFFNADTTKVSQASLDTSIVNRLLREIHKDPYFKNYTLSEFRNYRKVEYDRLAALVDSKPLWVIAANGSSDSTLKFFATADISSEFLWGVTNPLKRFGLELDLKAEYNDSTQTSKIENRQTLSFSGGLNFIAKNSKHKSIMELKASLTENYVAHGLYKDEAKNIFTFNGTLRFKITDQMWIPITFMYDPNTHNVFGFLNVTSNFDALGKLLKN